MANAVNLIDGLDGLAAGIVGIAAGAFFLYSLRLSDVGLLARATWRRWWRHRRRGVRRVPAPQRPPGQDLHGRRRGAVPRPAAGRHHDLVGGRTADQFSGQTFFFFAPLVIPFVILGVPILDTVLAIVRRARRRTRSPGRQGAPPPPPHAPGPRPAPGGVHPLGLDGGAVRLRPRPDLHQRGQRPGALRGSAWP